MLLKLGRKLRIRCRVLWLYFSSYFYFLWGYHVGSSSRGLNWICFLKTYFIFSEKLKTVSHFLENIAEKSPSLGIFFSLKNVWELLEIFFGQRVLVPSTALAVFIQSTALLCAFFVKASLDLSLEYSNSKLSISRIS